ncbi:hypothetical protein ACJJTC_019758 [Scirpophaga incertulas]
MNMLGKVFIFICATSAAFASNLLHAPLSYNAAPAVSSVSITSYPSPSYAYIANPVVTKTVSRPTLENYASASPVPLYSSAPIVSTYAPSISSYSATPIVAKTVAYSPVSSYILKSAPPAISYQSFVSAPVTTYTAVPAVKSSIKAAAPLIKTVAVPVEAKPIVKTVSIPSAVYAAAPAVKTVAVPSYTTAYVSAPVSYAESSVSKSLTASAHSVPISYATAYFNTPVVTKTVSSYATAPVYSAATDVSHVSYKGPGISYSW